MLAFEIMKRIRLDMKAWLTNDIIAEDGICLKLVSADGFFYWKDIDVINVTPAFKSFSEFLVWIDLNVNMF